ncbi:hypothetical protein AB0H00_31080 [Nocardia sp. NPDC023852]|uniref:hypothetical protein n=1 Tax=Nocardia sp. NPDC023852 TaxID=3154697 RepID=UPI0033EFF704
MCTCRPLLTGLGGPQAAEVVRGVAQRLARGGVVLDQAGPVLAVSRRADDQAAGPELARLVDILVNATRARAVA